MKNKIKLERIDNIIYQALAQICMQEGKNIVGNILMSIVAVRSSADLSIAKIYISFMTHTEEKKKLLKTVSEHKSIIKKLLGKYIGKKIRKIPDLNFYLDETCEQAIIVDRIFDQVSLK